MRLMASEVEGQALTAGGVGWVVRGGGAPPRSLLFPPPIHLIEHSTYPPPFPPSLPPLSSSRSPNPKQQWFVLYFSSPLPLLPLSSRPRPPPPASWRAW